MCGYNAHLWRIYGLTFCRVYCTHALYRVMFIYYRSDLQMRFDKVHILIRIIGYIEFRVRLCDIVELFGQGALLESFLRFNENKEI